MALAGYRRTAESSSGFAKRVEGSFRRARHRFGNCLNRQPGSLRLNISADRVNALLPWTLKGGKKGSDTLNYYAKLGGAFQPVHAGIARARRTR